MYRIRLENLDELREGKTIIYLAKLIHCSRPYLNSVFTGKNLIDDQKAYSIIQSICKESYKLNQKLEKYGMDAMISHFFKKVN